MFSFIKKYMLIKTQRELLALDKLVPRSVENLINKLSERKIDGNPILTYDDMPHEKKLVDRKNELRKRIHRFS